MLSTFYQASLSGLETPPSFLYYFTLPLLKSRSPDVPSLPCCQFSYSQSSSLLSPSLRTVASLAPPLVPPLPDILATLHSASSQTAIALAQAPLVGSVLYVPRFSPHHALIFVPLGLQKFASWTPMLSKVLTFSPGSLRSLNLLSTPPTMLFNPTPSLPSTSFLLNVKTRMAVSPKLLIIPR